MTADEAYGQDPQLRAALEARGTGYVLAVACPMRVRINHGRTAVRADTVAARLPATAWQRHSAGNGAKGPRYYDWAWIHTGTDSHHHLLVRVAGARRSIEECFQAAKGQVGLTHYEVSHWTSWHRHITLALLALLALTVLAADRDGRRLLKRQSDPMPPLADLHDAAPQLQSPLRGRSAVGLAEPPTTHEAGHSQVAEGSRRYGCGSSQRRPKSVTSP
ncbi:hypothetical protein SAMN04487981_118146 [Streptomyces sp. cf386]|nr:hypothetical protein SAMN04487981_118146 [Streptomyces sp. cf386]